MKPSPTALVSALPATCLVCKYKCFHPQQQRKDEMSHEKPNWKWFLQKKGYK